MGGVMRNILLFICGFIFGTGLTVSNMTDPNKILNFLDVTGQWDPTLLVVMAGAVVTTFTGYRFLKSKTQPLLSSSFKLPTKSDIDWRLITGSALFGIGWGLAGYCPGPALVGLAINGMDAVYLVIGMIIGSVVYKWSSACPH